MHIAIGYLNGYIAHECYTEISAWRGIYRLIKEEVTGNSASIYN